MSRCRKFHPAWPRPQLQWRGDRLFAHRARSRPGSHQRRRLPRPTRLGFAMAAAQRRRTARRRLAAGAQLHRDVGRLLGGDEFGRRAASQSALHPRGDRRASRRSRGQNSVRAAARRARRPVREGRGAAGAGAPPRAHRRAAARRNRRLRRRGDRSRRRCERAPGKRRRRPNRIASSRCCRPAEPRARPRWFRSPTAT